MAGARQPTDLVVARGRKHLTYAEEDARRDREVRVPPPARAKPPRWLPKDLHKDFRSIGKQLIEVGLYADLDADTLGRYLVARHEWLIATGEVERALRVTPEQPERDADAIDRWSRIQERYFKQARACALDMGLTVSSRCRLVLPSVAVTAAARDDGEDEFSALLARRQARMAEGLA